MLSEISQIEKSKCLYMCHIISLTCGIASKYINTCKQQTQQTTEFIDIEIRFWLPEVERWGGGQNV